MSVIKDFENDMMNIENTQECFVRLWQQLERTRCLLNAQCRRYCIRNVLKAWFGSEATDRFIWSVCRQTTLLLDEDNPICGNDYLPPPSLFPRKHRELLRVLVAVRLGIGTRRVNIKALDKAYGIAFPHSTPLNVSKKRKE
jgi:hypothetical protein